MRLAIAPRQPGLRAAGTVLALGMAMAGHAAAQPGSCGASVTGLLPGHHFTIQNNGTQQQEEVKDNGWIELCTLVDGKVPLSIGEQPQDQVCKAFGDLHTAGRESEQQLQIQCGHPVAAYVVNRGNATVSQFRVDTATGSWTPMAVAQVATGQQPVAIVVSADQRNAYVLNYQSRSISQYAIDPQSAALRPLQPAEVAARIDIDDGSPPTHPTALALSADGRRLIALDNALDPTLGTSRLADDMHAIGAQSFGNLFLQYQRTADGSLQPLRLSLLLSSALAEGALALASHPEDPPYLYGVSALQRKVKSFDTSCCDGALDHAALSGASPLTTGELPIAIAINAGGDWLYTVDFLGNSITEFAIHPLTGTLSGQGAQAQEVINIDPLHTITLDVRRPLSTATRRAPIALAISADDRYAYVLAQRDSSVQGFDIGPYDGRLQALQHAFRAQLGNLPNSLVAAPFGGWLYATFPPDGVVRALRIDAQDGALGAPLVVAAQLQQPQAIAFAHPYPE